jgi:hypothetical protein
MNERIQELAEQANLITHKVPNGLAHLHTEQDVKKFAELIVRECINTLEFHGFDDAVPYIKWMATNNLGVKE